jgi:hypothetical protein
MHINKSFYILLFGLLIGSVRTQATPLAEQPSFWYDDSVKRGWNEEW